MDTYPCRLAWLVHRCRTFGTASVEFQLTRRRLHEGPRGSFASPERRLRSGRRPK